MLVFSGELDDKLSDYWKAEKIKMELEKAKQLFQEGEVLHAATLGLPEAQEELWFRFYNGTNGMAKDYVQSFKWALKAAERGVKDAQFRVGYAYDEGEGTEKDWLEAIRWYELAATQVNLLIP